MASGAALLCVTGRTGGGALACILAVIQWKTIRSMRRRLPERGLDRERSWVKREGLDRLLLWGINMT